MSTTVTIEEGVPEAPGMAELRAENAALRAELARLGAQGVEVRLP